MGYFYGLGDALGLQAKSEKGVAGGYASLDALGWLPQAQLPPDAINVKRHGAVGNGVTNDTAAFTAAIAAAAAGSTIFIPNGEYLVSAITTTKQLHFVGESAWTTVLKAVAGHTGAVIEFNLPVDLPPSGIRNYYGASVAALGIDLSSASAATGILVGANSGWVRLSDVSCRGGAISIDNRGPNGWFENLQLFDAAKFIVIDGDTGLELTIRDTAMGRNSAGQTVVGIEVVLDNAVGVKGALKMDNVRLSSGTTGGVSTVCGFKVTAPSIVSVPVFARGCIFDNITGSHGSQATCAMELVNIQDVTFTDGWLNAGTFGPAVRITGGGRLRFTGNQMFGGPTGDPKTYEFVSGSTNGFYSQGNYTPTNIIYHIPASGYPINVFTDDVSIIVTPIAVTNRPREFAASQGVRFGATDPAPFSDADMLTSGEQVPADRFAAWAGQTTTAASGWMNLMYFTATKTETIASIQAITGATAAGATPTLVRFGVYEIAANGDGTLVASTPNDTALFAATDTAYTKAFSVAFSKVAGKRYAIAVLLVTAAAVPVLLSVPTQPLATMQTQMGLAPQVAGVVVSMTDLPASFAAASAVANLPRFSARLIV